MEQKILIRVVILLAILSFTATSANAQITYLTQVNNVLATTYVDIAGSVDCMACHSTAGNVTNDNGVTSLANTWRAVGAAGLAAADSDADGFTNLQEVTASPTTYDYNDSALTPFIRASGGVKLTNVHSTHVADTETAFVDAYTLANLTVPAGSEILGAISVTTNSLPVTLTYKAGAVASSSTLFVVDTYATSNTALAGASWSVSATGGVTITALPVGQPSDIVVQRITPVVETGGSFSGGGCLSRPAKVSLIMMLILLSFGSVLRRKQG